jgi:DNL zinc finger
MKASVVSSLGLLSLLLADSFAFAPTTTTVSRTISLLARRRNRSFEDSSDNEPRSEIPQLPPTTSFDSDTATNWQSDAAFAARKFELQYTCKVCDTRNTHKVSRIAYNKGVVICVCKGCMSQHLISDHLGFTNLQFDGNLESYFSDNKDGAESVQRVSEDVFQLEKILGLDTKSGSIFGPDGNAAME